MWVNLMGAKHVLDGLTEGCGIEVECHQTITRKAMDQGDRSLIIPSLLDPV